MMNMIEIDSIKTFHENPLLDHIADNQKKVCLIYSSEEENSLRLKFIKNILIDENCIFRVRTNLSSEDLYRYDFFQTNEAKGVGSYVAVVFPSFYNTHNESYQKILSEMICQEILGRLVIRPVVYSNQQVSLRLVRFTPLRLDVNQNKCREQLLSLMGRRPGNFQCMVVKDTKNNDLVNRFNHTLKIFDEALLIANMKTQQKGLVFAKQHFNFANHLKKHSIEHLHSPVSNDTFPSDPTLYTSNTPTSHEKVQVGQIMVENKFESFKICDTSRLKENNLSTKPMPYGKSWHLFLVGEDALARKQKIQEVKEQMEHRGYKCSSLEEFPAGKDILQMSLESITDSVLCVTVDPNQLKNLHKHIYHQILRMKVEDMKQGYIWGMLEDPEDDLYASYIQPIDFTRPPTVWAKQFEEAIKMQSHGSELTQSSDNDNTILKTIKDCILEMKSTFHEMPSTLQRISLSKVLEIRRLTSFLLSTHGIGVAQSLPCLVNSMDETASAMDPTAPFMMSYEQSDISFEPYRPFNEASLTDTIITDESTTFEINEQGTIGRRQKQTTSTMDLTVPFTMHFPERFDISDDLPTDTTSGMNLTFPNTDVRVPFLECSDFLVTIDDDDNSSELEPLTLSPTSSCIPYVQESYGSTDSCPDTSYQTPDDTELIEVSPRTAPLMDTNIAVESATSTTDRQETIQWCRKPECCEGYCDPVMTTSTMDLTVPFTMHFPERFDISDDLPTDTTSGMNLTFPNTDVRVPFLECSDFLVTIDDDDNSSELEPLTLSPTSSCIPYVQEPYGSTDSCPDTSYQTPDDTELIEVSPRTAPLMDTNIAVESATSTTDRQETIQWCRKPECCEGYCDPVMTISTMDLTVPFTMHFPERFDISDDLPTDTTSGMNLTLPNTDVRVPFLECSDFLVTIDDDDNSSELEPLTLSPTSSCIPYVQEPYGSTDSCPDTSYQTPNDTELIEVSPRTAPLMDTNIAVESATSTTDRQETIQWCRKPECCEGYCDPVMNERLTWQKTVILTSFIVLCFGPFVLSTKGTQYPHLSISAMCERKDGTDSSAFCFIIASFLSLIFLNTFFFFCAFIIWCFVIIVLIAMLKLLFFRFFRLIRRRRLTTIFIP